MKKHSILTLMAIAAISFFIFSCKNEDLTSKNEIIAKDVLHSNKDIATVKAVVPAEVLQSTDDVVLATTKYENDGFKLQLPKTVSDQYLVKLADGEQNGLTISDLTAKSTAVMFCAYDNTDNQTGIIYLVGMDLKYFASATYLYSDKKFTIKGKLEEGSLSVEYDCNVKKGWNVLYLLQGIANGTNTFTTQKPSEVKMEWTFDSGLILPFNNFEDGIAKPVTFKTLQNNLISVIEKMKSENL